ncbi:SGNH/GDSL hydrolase family protein [Candidatus Poriferisodalis sp.]|uniref:SGNH/GDSL hydrolase family protein n=1 Tax=Candidatus Poriferisodalis sp. TaxID=3101277 RepID=UPI003B017471
MSGTQAGFGATVAVACAAHDLFRVDDWPPSNRHDDIWHDVTVCEASLPDMAETGGTASIPTRPDGLEMLVLRGSDPVSRAGRLTELVLELRRPVRLVYRGSAEPVRAAAPVANAPIGAAVTHGPSAGASVMCLVPSAIGAAASGYSSSCATDAHGQVTVRYLVPTNAAHALRRGRDTLLVFEDRDQDGAHDHLPGRVGHEPAAAIDIPVAKAPSYVALGDSYSSGEQGRPDAAGFAGGYQNGVSPADPHCRRWSEAYPNVIAREFLGDSTVGINATFATFACTGAITYNIHDPRGPGDEVTQEDLIETNKPSHPVPSLSYDSDTGQLLPRPSDWEPRQAVSLANAQAMNDVDMITITIGGNDVGFANVIRACATPLIGNLDSTCNQDDLALSWAEVQDRIEDALTKIRAASPRASIYALGYPPITPRPTPCPSDVRDCPELGINQQIDDCPALSAQDILAHSAGVESLPAVFRPLGYLARWSPLGIAASVNGLSLDEIASGIAKIDHVEADFLWSSAGALNRAVQRAAAAAGVHFVDIRSGDQFASSTGSLVGRDPCGADPWLHGFVLDMEQTPASAKSFHPNVAGHTAYARNLEQYIRAQIVAGTDLSEAGLPANPKAASR